MGRHVLPFGHEDAHAIEAVRPRAVGGPREHHPRECRGDGDRSDPAGGASSPLLRGEALRTGPGRRVGRLGGGECDRVRRRDRVVGSRRSDRGPRRGGAPSGRLRQALDERRGRRRGSEVPCRESVLVLPIHRRGTKRVAAREQALHEPPDGFVFARRQSDRALEPCLALAGGVGTARMAIGQLERRAEGRPAERRLLRVSPLGEAVGPGYVQAGQEGAPVHGQRLFRTTVVERPFEGDRIETKSARIDAQHLVTGGHDDVVRKETPQRVEGVSQRRAGALLARLRPEDADHGVTPAEADPTLQREVDQDRQALRVPQKSRVRAFQRDAAEGPETHRGARSCSQPLCHPPSPSLGASTAFRCAAGRYVATRPE